MSTFMDQLQLNENYVVPTSAPLSTGQDYDSKQKVLSAGRVLGHVQQQKLE